MDQPINNINNNTTRINKCEKCGYIGEMQQIQLVNGLLSGVKLCSICANYAPSDAKLLKIYVNEKIDGTILETFRKARISMADRTKAGMQKTQEKGEVISRAPKGYKILDKKLVIDDLEAQKVRELFEEYANSDISLGKLAKKHEMTTSGIKKLLQSIVYIGLIRVNDIEKQGLHQAITTKELFEKVKIKLGK